MFFYWPELECRRDWVFCNLLDTLFVYIQVFITWTHSQVWEHVQRQFISYLTNDYSRGPTQTFPKGLWLEMKVSVGLFHSLFKYQGPSA